MREVHASYVLENFRGERWSLADAYGSPAMPTGTGDCCAPKLIAAAVRGGVRPTGLVELWWGPAGERAPGELSTPCASRCQPILGTMLCGFDEL